MNSDCPVPPIPIDRPISYEDWLKGRRWRREIGNRVAPEIIRREEGSADRRLHELHDGKRGLPFTPTELL